ncbi:Proteasome assembly chaperone 2 [Platysternon megacephalum]|uniref:Proteasome assembly chaperone 2 n=1 Tax=Platysternon megacephalum TaxID=55544 RepID=A0A4D9EQ22_9SAUR|nr:Proteasome assembly chaperone 2 [Platysternon megacephalum]
MISSVLPSPDSGYLSPILTGSAPPLSEGSDSSLSDLGVHSSVSQPVLGQRTGDHGCHSSHSTGCLLRGNGLVKHESQANICGHSGCCGASPCLLGLLFTCLVWFPQGCTKRNGTTDNILQY